MRSRDSSRPEISDPTPPGTEAEATSVIGGAVAETDGAETAGAGAETEPPLAVPGSRRDRIERGSTGQ